MTVAQDDILASGGVAPDDSLMISFFENALNSNYAQIRQLVRYKNHTSFEAYYQDMLAQVKAEAGITNKQGQLGAFAVGGVLQPPDIVGGRARSQRGGRSNGRGRDGRGNNRGGGNLAETLNVTHAGDA